MLFDPLLAQQLQAPKAAGAKTSSYSVPSHNTCMVAWHCDIAAALPELRLPLVPCPSSPECGGQVEPQCPSPTHVPDRMPELHPTGQRLFCGLVTALLAFAHSMTCGHLSCFAFAHSINRCRAMWRWRHTGQDSVIGQQGCVQSDVAINCVCISQRKC